MRDRPDRPQSAVVDRPENANGAARLVIPVNFDLNLIASPRAALKVGGLGPTAQPYEFVIGTPTVANQMLPQHCGRFTIAHALVCLDSMTSTQGG